jgi:peptidoglycan/LPS O-acetylase OafA/YrhL
MPSPATEPRDHFGRLDSLRGLGAVAVAGYHLGGCPVHGWPLLPVVPWPGADPVQDALRRLGVGLLSSHAAVTLFFVLSGFVLRLSLDRGPKAPTAAAAKFLLARAFRLYPIVALSALICLLTTATMSAGAVVQHLLLLDVSANGVLWSLQVEVLVAPILVALYFLERRYGPRVLVPIALVTTALIFRPTWTGFRPLSTNLFAFVLGMMVPTYGRRLAERLSRRGATAWVTITGVALLLPNACFGRYSLLSTLFEGYIAFGLVALVAYRPDAAALKWLDARPLRFLGRISCSYYVLHMATLPLALSVATVVIPASWSAAAPALVGWLVVGAWLVAIVPLTACAYYLVEVPGIVLGRRVGRWLRLDAKPAPTSAPVAREEVPRLAA